MKEIANPRIVASSAAQGGPATNLFARERSGGATCRCANQQELYFWNSKSCPPQLGFRC
ncbi:uncharacterized protein BKA78DRAFT_317529 [Phyllosticta capitalensis]|uniref:uncharacterized protein n=1 Tax=Phyllosticta capitalensis TaxID=121624 RepID=UPI00312EBD68